MTSDILARALRATIELKRAELATLENALEVTEGEDKPTCPGGPSSKHGGWPAPCCGPISERVCAECGHSTARCEVHGGSRAATYHHQEHVDACDQRIVPRVVRDPDFKAMGWRKSLTETR